MNWQPIETAPKDGSYILSYFASDGCVVLQWDKWFGGWFDGLSEEEWTPSHWMPLPPPPSSKT